MIRQWHFCSCRRCCTIPSSYRHHPTLVAFGDYYQHQQQPNPINPISVSGSLCALDRVDSFEFSPPFFHPRQHQPKKQSRQLPINQHPRACCVQILGTTSTASQPTQYWCRDLPALSIVWTCLSSLYHYSIHVDVNQISNHGSFRSTNIQGRVVFKDW